MSASRMPWEIPSDLAAHEWKLVGTAEVCKHCEATRLYVAFFGGSCPGPKPAEPVHWAGEPGEGPTSLHGNGASSFARTSGDEDEVTCKLCLTLLARESGDQS